MTGTLRQDDDDSRVVAGELTGANQPLLSTLAIAISFVVIILLVWIAISVIRGNSDDAQSDEREPSGPSADSSTPFEAESSTLVRGDQVAVGIGPDGHRVDVACFLPAPSSPPLVVFLSSAPADLDLRAEATFSDAEGNNFAAVAGADSLRPGEQRREVARTPSSSAVVIEQPVVGCHIDGVQAGSQIVRFG